MKNGKRKRSLTMLVMLLCTCILVFVGGGVSKQNVAMANEIETETFSYWISAGIDASYYPTYRDSAPFVYLLNKTWPTSHGDMKLDFDFIIPAAGSERDNFNTLLATGEYADIMELSMYSGSIVELYEDGVILDLTEYIEQYMPNYLAWLDRHPVEKLTATNIVNGEPRYLVIYSGADIGKAWCGYMYRRDWILKYGTNPIDGSTFSGQYTAFKEDGTPVAESWEDNIVFPSGGSDPVYISDWEWMFEIFDIARASDGITDGYNLSLYYPGHLGTGDLVCAFGGGGSVWYRNQDDQIVFGATDEDFRVYLQAMNTWYSKGWIDKAFSEHASDMFYRIDEVKVRQGKVGLWMGLSSQLLNTMDAGFTHTDGIMVYPAANPINDVYGTEAQQYKTPYTMYANSVLASAFAVTDKASEKDLELLFRFFDYLYTDEGALVGYFTAEQIAELNLPIYEKYGLQDGTFQIVDTANGPKIMPVDAILQEGGNLKIALTGKRGINRDPNSLTLETSVRVEEMREVWNTYASTGLLTQPFTAQLSIEDGKVYSKAFTAVDEFLKRHVPTFIKGTKDPFSDDDWNAFVNAINKYQPDKTTLILQNLLDTLLQGN